MATAASPASIASPLAMLYPADLSERGWTILAPLLPPPKPGGRPRAVDLRRILTGRFPVLRSGCQWRLLPREYGPWSTVYGYLRAWRLDGTWERVHTALREQVRRQVGRQQTPSAAIIDSQSVKTTERGGSAWLRRRQAGQWPEAPPPGRYLGPAAEGRRASGERARPRGGQAGAR